MPEATAMALDAAEELTPPERFRDEHHDWVRRLRAELPLAREAKRAARQGDVLGIALAQLEGTLSFGAGVAGWSEPFCRAMVQRFGGGEERVCPRGESIPGGEYGQQLHAALLPIATEIEPRTSIPPVLSAPVVFAWLEEIQPDVERLLAEIREQVEALDAPSELEADHERLLEHFDEISDVARRITAATEERDIGELQRLFTESVSTTQRTYTDLSDAARPIVGKFFEGP